MTNKDLQRRGKIWKKLVGIVRQNVVGGRLEKPGLWVGKGIAGEMARKDFRRLHQD